MLPAPSAAAAAAAPKPPRPVPALLCHALLATATLLGLAAAGQQWPGSAWARSAAVRTLTGRQRSHHIESEQLVPRHRAVSPGDPAAYHPPKPAAGVAVDASVLWGRQFLVDGPELEQALTFGDSRRLRRQVARLLAGEPVRVVAVGASITAGAGGREWSGTRTAWPGYVAQFADWLRAAFPAANASVHNAGMAGTFGGVFAQCFDSLVPPADMYILEQATFDGTEPERCYCKSHYVDTPVQLGIERLMRRMLRQPNHPAVVALNVFGFRFPNRGVYQRSVENQIQVMAQFYGLPAASLRAAAWRRMLAGSNGFDVSTSVKLYQGAPLPPDRLPLYYDQIHPWGPTGHRVLADLLVRLVQSTALSLTLQPLSEADAVPAGRPLPPPLTPGNYETNQSSCWLGDNFRLLVGGTASSGSGFAWVNERPEAAEKKAQKWGFVATRSGASLEFTIDTRVGSSEDPTNRLILSYLASYEGMGAARVECMQATTDSMAHFFESAGLPLQAPGH
ncbi:expressed protein isoform B [Chlorella sorokiniana]|uniref:Expressed protein isoform B n=1 Tax=Chlorella sorokiniana TaxID=3076 RepID=A0A2P6TQ40_CHLSO|nr:expressed protein isoform B [Chlorella sorokiniana]|eukprot:PRW56151.1 expressed protein isoform B [Chlorella sorokiniana]